MTEARATVVVRPSAKKPSEPLQDGSGRVTGQTVEFTGQMTVDG